LNKESKVVATGYTDHLGNAEVNQRLSDGRAKSVADALKAGQVTSLGVGARRPLYNNDLPEGRFYNRTVEVRVETPVDYGQEK
jgi:OOP family OmpA-OmpF porin